MKKILVTGSTGLVGKAFLQIQKSRDFDFFFLDSKTNLLKKDETLSKFQDIKPDYVIHLAAKVGGIKANMNGLADFFEQNIQMNMNVCEASKLCEAKLVSFLSTCVYPDAKYVNYPLTEDQLHLGPPHESNFGYAYAKRMLDVQSRCYRKQHGCNFVTLVPNNLYGPNDNYDLENSHVVPALIRKVFEAKMSRLDKVKIWGTGKPLREFTYAKDAAQIALWACENYNDEDPLNIGCTEQVSIFELATMISSILEYKGEIIFDSEKPDGQMMKPSSNKKLRSLGYSSEYTDLKTGLEETVSHFSQNYPNLRGINLR